MDQRIFGGIGLIMKTDLDLRNRSFGWVRNMALWKVYSNDYFYIVTSNLSATFSGNRNIYELTSDNYRYLRIEMMDHDCVWKYAEYSMFFIEDATNKYRLHIGGYSGDARMIYL